MLNKKVIFGHRKNRKPDIERIITLPIHKSGKISTKSMKKEAWGYQSVGAEYVTEKINSLILQLLFKKRTQKIPAKELHKSNIQVNQKRKDIKLLVICSEIPHT